MRFKKKKNPTFIFTIVSFNFSVFLEEDVFLSAFIFFDSKMYRTYANGHNLKLPYFLIFDFVAQVTYQIHENECTTCNNESTVLLNS